MSVPVRRQSARRWYLTVEFVAVFFGLVTAYALLLRGTSPIPVLLVLGAAAVFHLRRTGFDRRSFWRPEALRGQLRPVLVLWAVTAAGCVAAVAVLMPGSLLALPREQPALWALVVVFYPLASVYPQELLFRAFLFHRYEPVFGPTGTVAASALAFGFVHIAFGNWVAVLLSTAGGWIFASRYRETRSLLTVSVEHALYGLLMFTVGLGQFFYHGTVTS